MKLLEIDGKPVVNAPKGVTLHITPADVAKGKKKAPDCCAAAQACMRQMKAKRALVHLSRIYLEKPDRWVRYVTPGRLRTEIISFDRGHRFEAGDYQLTPVQPSVQSRNGKKQTRRQTGTMPQRGHRTKPSVVKGVRYSASPSMYAA